MPFFNSALYNHIVSSTPEQKTVAPIRLTEATREDLKEAQERAVKAANAPENLSKLQEDIAKLVGLNTTIQRTFIEVGTKLQEVDRINPGEKFYPPWNELASEFNVVVRESNATASKLGATCRSFDTVVLYFTTGEELTKEEKLNLLQGYKDQADRDSRSAEEIRRRFEDLSDRVGRFGDRFDGFAEDLLKDKREELEAVTANILRLTNEIKELKRNITLAAVGLGLGLVGAAIAIAIFPAFAEAILAAGASVVAAIAKSIFDWQAEIREKQAQILVNDSRKNQLLKEIKELEEAQRVLGRIQTVDIPTIVGALSAFSGVWSEIEAQCNDVADYIEKGLTTPLIDVYVLEAKSIYDSLGKGLEDYGRTVGLASGIKPAAKVVPAWAKCHPAVEKVARKIYN